jgi:hypothetical protein
MSFRLSVNEIDLSGFVQPQIDETGAMVVISSQGPGSKPIYCQSEPDVILNFGIPSVDNPSVFEAIAFARKAPIWVISAVSNNALYGGVMVRQTTMASFPAMSGIVDPDNYDFRTYSSGTADNTISHVLFNASAYNSTNQVKVASVSSTSGTQFIASIYNVSNGTARIITSYTYSLTREQDNFGKSLYFADVFKDNPYLICKYNTNTTVVAGTYSLLGTVAYTLTGGYRGSTPQSNTVTTAWQVFISSNKYPIKIFMDALGGHAGDIDTLITTYQPYAIGISVIPLDKSVADAVTYRNGLSLDTDVVSLYYNWSEIKDPYNNSYVWISNVGSIGGKYAQMVDVYDSYSPAGIDENHHGGQLSDWTPIDVEYDFTDANLQTLDEAQINPCILDEIYGLMIYGDKTLQVSLSDTSYVGTRRIYNFIIKNIIRQVLRKQEFKNNDESHRYKAKAMTDNFLSPILAGEYLRSALVICDSSNNTNEVLELRRFILDVLVQATPNSQKCILRLTRLSQTAIIADFLPA